MRIDLLPFIAGFGLGLGCCIAAVIVVLRALGPFRSRARMLQSRIGGLGLAQAQADALRLAATAEKIAELRSRAKDPF